MTLTVEPLREALGARVTGVDLGQALDDWTFRAIHRAWLDHQVLIFPDQVMTQDDQVRFAKMFGDLPDRAPYAAEGTTGRRAHDSVMLISNIREDGRLIGSLPGGEMMFHSDGSYDEDPYRYTMLYGVEVPGSGGDTTFANMYAAYDTLPPALKRRIFGCDAVHGFYAGRDVTPEFKAPLGVGDVSGAMTHPVVIAHEETGRPVLYVSRMLTQRIVGLPENQSDAVLDQLLDHSEQPELIYVHRWTPGDFVIWDNRCVNHSRTDFAETERRLLRRTTVMGVRPAAYSDGSVSASEAARRPASFSPVSK